MTSTANQKLNVRGVSKRYRFKGNAGDSLHVLDRVDLHARDGELVSVIGPSGSGKSTLLNIVAGLEEPSEGTVELDGALTAQRLGRVGYMQQKDLLFPWRSVLDNAVLPLELRGVPRDEARGRALKLVEGFGLKGFEHTLPGLLSGGMRQRAAFLRTVLADNDLLLLDEPFGALDALTRAQMQEWLLGLWGGLRKTIVLVTHDVDEALLLSDRVYVLTASPGRVALVLDVTLPRPRSRRMVTQDAFIRLKERVLVALRLQEAAV